jgi:hypothetical protein
VLRTVLETLYIGRPAYLDWQFRMCWMHSDTRGQ